MTLAFDDHIKGVRGLVRVLHVLLTRLQADQLTHQARAIEELEADRPLTQKLAAGAEIDDFHEILQEAKEGLCPQLRSGELTTLRVTGRNSFGPEERFSRALSLHNQGQRPGFTIY
jgi:hypothetical protein